MTLGSGRRAAERADDKRAVASIVGREGERGGENMWGSSFGPKKMTPLVFVLEERLARRATIVLVVVAMIAGDDAGLEVIEARSFSPTVATMMCGEGGGEFFATSVDREVDVRPG